MIPMILASSSSIRAQLLRQVGLDPEIRPARIDETAILDSLRAEEASPRDIADTLAEMKARKIAEKGEPGLVLGCDQVLEHKGTPFQKAQNQNEAHAQLMMLQGSTHRLLSAAVLYDEGKPVWRTVGQVRLTMRPMSAIQVDRYLDRNWARVADAVGCYKLEEEGARLFSRVDGDYFTVLGLPLLDLVSYLVLRGDMEP